MDASPSCAKSDCPVVLLGLGFTTRRLARRLLFRGYSVFGVVRNPARFKDLESLGLRLAEFPNRAVVVHSIPTIPESDSRVIHDFVAGLEPARIVYISTTGVYGNHSIVNAETPVDGADVKAQLRIGEEEWVARSAPGSLILRPAAIYGPGRGVHVRIGNGERPRATGPGIVSRIHVDDLAGILEAGTISTLQGAWPVADERPSSSDEINAWCASMLRLPIQQGTLPEIIGRRVDGSAVRTKLGYQLRYPDYQSGILASLAEERASAPRTLKGS